MSKSPDPQLKKLPLNSGAGHMPALGFGTFIPDSAVTKTPRPETLRSTRLTQAIFKSRVRSRNISPGEST